MGRNFFCKVWSLGWECAEWDGSVLCWVGVKVGIRNKKRKKGVCNKRCRSFFLIFLLNRVKNEF